MADSRVIAFAGNGDTSLENATALLNNWLPEDVEIEGFYIPDAIAARKQKGLANVVTYLTTNWGDDSGDDPFETVPATELVHEISSVDGDPYLIVILGEAEPDAVTSALIDEARAKEIPVLDLAAGLDEYTADEPDAEPVKEAPEPEPERPARRRRTTTTPEPAEAVSEPEKPRRTIGKPRIARTEDGGHALVSEPVTPDEDRPPFDGPYKGEVVKGTVETTDLEVSNGISIDGVRQVIREELAAMLYGALSGISGGQALLAAGGPKPRTDHASPETVDAPTAAYIKDSDGALRRRGRGKPRAGEEVVWLTAAQAATQGFQEDK